MDVIDILGPRKALKRSKPMPNFGVPSNRPCSAGSLLKRTTGQVNIPKLMSLSTSTASKLESDVKEQCIQIFCKNKPTTVVDMYPVEMKMTTGNTPAQAGTETTEKAVLQKSTTGPENAKVPINDAFPNKSKPIPNKSGVSTKLNPASGHLEGHSDGSVDDMKLIVAPRNIDSTIINAEPTEADSMKMVVPPKRVDSTVNNPRSPNENNNKPNKPAPNPPSMQSINSQKREQNISLIQGTKGEYTEKKKPVADNNAGGDSNMHTVPSMASLESRQTIAKNLNKPQKSESYYSESTKPHSQVSKYNHNDKKQMEESECKEPQMIMANNGAIRFQLPGRVQHKTTIKLAHYPEKTGETVVINVPEGDMDSYCEEECGNTTGQLRNPNGLPALPPIPVGNNNLGNDFSTNMNMNAANGYQQQFYNPGSPGQNFYYSQQPLQQQQQYMQQNPNNFQQQFGNMYGMSDAQNGFSSNSNACNYYPGPPPQPPLPNYQPYGYGYPI